MNYIILGLLILATLVVVLRPMTEHMTNDDLMSTLKTFGEQGTKPKKKKQTSEKDKLPIYGPSGVLAPPPPKPAPSSKGKDGSQYPEIYGPDVVLTPGKKSSNGKHESDNTEDDTYDYNPDLQKAFPVEGPPQPFLGDFSKIQH